MQTKNINTHLKRIKWIQTFTRILFGPQFHDYTFGEYFVCTQIGNGLLMQHNCGFQLALGRKCLISKYTILKIERYKYILNATLRWSCMLTHKLITYNMDRPTKHPLPLPNISSEEKVGWFCGLEKIFFSQYIIFRIPFFI